MDLQEFEQSVIAAIEDPSSTIKCKLHLEESLTQIRKRDPSYLQNHLKTVTRYFEAAIQLALKKPEINPDYRQKLNIISSGIRSISKNDAGKVVTVARRVLRQSIPELRAEDQRHLLEFGEAAMDSRDPVRLSIALQKILRTHMPCAALIFLTFKIARKLNDRKTADSALNSLTKHCDDPFFMKKIVFSARDTGNIPVLLKAKEKLEQYLGSTVNLTMYATVCRVLKDNEGITRAMQLLLPRCHDPICLTTYAALAKDRGNTSEMKYALELLESRLKDPKCLSIYATLARKLKDDKAMEKAHVLLEALIGDDVVCLTAYAKNSKSVGGPDSQRRAMMKLKPHLEDPINMSLYMEVAESESAPESASAPAPEIASSPVPESAPCSAPRPANEPEPQK